MQLFLLSRKEAAFGAIFTSFCSLSQNTALVRLDGAQVRLEVLVGQVLETALPAGGWPR